jgi:Uma2 family endonuclease
MTAPLPVKTDFKARFTTAEFLQMCAVDAFPDMKIELVDGRLERHDLAMNRHAMLQGKVWFALAGVIDAALLLGTVGIILGDDTVVACDGAVLRKPITGNRMLVPDDIALVMEIAETTIARDMGMKRIKYASAGIAAYWVIDGARSVVHVFAEPVDGDYASINTVRFGAPLRCRGPGRL